MPSGTADYYHSRHTATASLLPLLICLGDGLPLPRQLRKHGQLDCKHRVDVETVPGHLTRLGICHEISALEGLLDALNEKAFKTKDRTAMSAGPWLAISGHASDLVPHEHLPWQSLRPWQR
jgi:hypothetical protein